MNNELQFNFKPAHLAQLRAVVAQKGKAYIHGCGNIYFDESASSLRARFANPQQEDAQYRATFNSLAEVPKTVEALDAIVKAGRVKKEEKRKTDSSNDPTVIEYDWEDSDKKDQQQDDDDTPTLDDLKKANAHLNDRSAHLDSREDDLHEKAKNLDENAAAVNKKAQEVEAAKTDLEKQMAELKRKQAELDQREKALAEKTTGKAATKPGAGNTSQA